MRLNKTELQKTRKPYGCIARTVSAVSEQAPKTDVGTGLWICSICAQSYGETLVIGKSPMVEMATWWRTSIIYVYLARSVMYTSQSSFGRNSTTSLCLVEWLATWTIKKGTRFRCHLSKALCTRMMSTSSQNEFAPVQWLKRGWKTHLWKMWLRRKGEKMTQCRGRHSRRKPPRWRSSKSFPGTQDEKYARQAANVDGIREPTFFRWHALLLLVVEILRHPGKLWIPRRRRSRLRLEGRNGYIGEKWHVVFGWLFEECEGYQQPLGASKEAEGWWFDCKLKRSLYGLKPARGVGISGFYTLWRNREWKLIQRTHVNLYASVMARASCRHLRGRRIDRGEW